MFSLSGGPMSHKCPPTKLFLYRCSGSPLSHCFLFHLLYHSTVSASICGRTFTSACSKCLAATQSAPCGSSAIAHKAASLQTAAHSAPVYPSVFCTSFVNVAFAGADADAAAEEDKPSCAPPPTASTPEPHTRATSACSGTLRRCMAKIAPLASASGNPT